MSWTSVPRASKLLVLVIGVVSGAAYGLFVRLGAQMFPQSNVFVVMSIGFVFLMPLGVGFVSVYIVERKEPQPVWMWAVISCLAILLGLVGTVMAVWEGYICVVMFAPIGLIVGLIGGLIAGFFLRRRHKRAAGFIPMACVMALPLLITPWEQSVLQSRQLRNVENVIEIHASSGVVWQNIERVAPIAESELRDSWSHRIGFPNPIEATLSREGIGGVRHATFERGILFIETIDTWEPQQRLGFSIRAQADAIPRTTLDEHVTIGGQYFDVLHGEYRIEPLANGAVLLHLSSQHRLTTDFNWYAHLWTDAVMSDLQQRILLVVKKRAESAATEP
jgi:hypothetical protein